MRKQQKLINLFYDRSIHSIKQVVSIGDEEDLNQMWEYIMMLHSSDASEVYTFFIGLYELSARFLDINSGIFFEIIIEQSDENYYFTVWNKEFIYFARKQWKKRRLDYRFKNKRITIRLSKTQLQEKKVEKSTVDDKRINHLLATIPTAEVGEILLPYDFMDKNDVIELGDIVRDMNDYICIVQESGFTAEALMRIRSYFSRISVMLNHYEEIEEVAIIVTEFSMMLHQNKESFLQLNMDQIRLIDGFTRNFERWLKVLFLEGGARLNFMDRSLRADMEMIRFMIEPPIETSEEELDAIFDF